MTIRLEILADTPQELFTQLAGAIGAMRAAGGGAAAQTVPVKEPAMPTATAEGALETAPKNDAVKETATRSKKKKDVQPERETKPENAEPSKDEAAADVPNIDDVRAALKKLASAKGDDVVWTLLGTYKVKRASDVAEDKRAEIINKIEELCEAE